MPRPDERVDEGMIHAWLDGELSADEAARVERLVAENAEWAAAAAEARGLVAASSRILRALDVVAGDVIPRGGSAAPAFGESRATRPDIAPKLAPRRAIPMWLRVAAGAVLMAGVAYMGRTTTETARVTGTESDEVVAAPAIASEPAASEPVAADAPAPNKAAEQSITANVPALERRDAPSASSRTTAPTARTAVAAPAPQAALNDALMPPPPEAKIVVAPLASAAPQPTPQELRGVAGGVASGVASTAPAPRRDAIVAKSVVGSVTAAARADASNKAEFATAERRAEASRSLRQATTGPNLLPNTIEGCWRIETTTRADSIQRALPIVRISGDTTFTVLAPNGITAWVVRDSANVLRGRTRDSAGVPVTLRATQISCPVSP